MVASLWQAVPTKTNIEIVQFIKQSAHLFQNPNMTVGYGIPDFNLALANALKTTDFKRASFVIYPNPMQKFVAIDFDSPSAEFILYNKLGQLVRKLSVTANQHLLVEDLPSGLYFYQISSELSIQKGKLLKL